MAKSKSAPKAAAAPVKSVSDKVKHGRVTKAAEVPKVKSTELKTKVEKSDKKASKKSKKAPTPPPESESESEDSEDESGDESDSSESETEVTKPAQVNGTAKAVNGAKPAADESDSESESESESEDEPVPAKATKVAAAAESSDESESESDSDAEAAVQTKSGVTPSAAVVNGKTAESDESESDDEEDEDDSEESDESEEEAAPVPAKKRKADAVEEPAAKKTKTASGGGSKNLFVGNLSWNVDEDWLSREFAEFGELSGVRIITDRDSGRSKGFGYVEFVNEEDAAKALEAKKGAELDGRELNVDFSTPRDDSGAGANRGERVNQRANKFGDSASVPSDTLFVGNISFNATAELFQETFEEYGTITRVTLPTDPDTQALKGFGYVGFASVDEAKAALEALNGADIAGRNIRLDFATPRADNGGGSRGGRGGFGGGFRGGRGNDRGGRGGRGGFSRGGGRGDSRGGFRGGRGRGGSTNRGGIGDFSGKKKTF